MKSYLNEKKGQALLEIIISIAVVSIALVAIVSRAVEAVKNSNFARNQVLAARFAQEGVEWARAQRDQMGWTAFENLIVNIDHSPVTYCVLDLSENLSCRSYSCTSITIAPCLSTIPGTPFTRQIRFTYVNPDATTEDRIDVQATVEWTDNNGTHNAQYTTILSEWFD
jgi:type II secretory pathway pseudopilin PulG